MMDHRHLLLWQKLLKCLRQIALSTLRISLGLPLSPIARCCFHQYILWLSCCSLLVIVLWLLFFSVLSRYCYKLLLFSIGMSALRFCVRLYFTALQLNWDMYPLLEMKKKVVPVFLSAKRNERNTIDCNKRFHVRRARDYDYLAIIEQRSLHPPYLIPAVCRSSLWLAITTLRNLYPFGIEPETGNSSPARDKVM